VRNVENAAGRGFGFLKCDSHGLRLLVWSSFKCLTMNGKSCGLLVPDNFVGLDCKTKME
jgi:hypothetical protein